MKTLSVKQPWAYLLCAGVKDIENRTWKLPEKYKGERVLIHASANPKSWEQFTNYIENLDPENLELQRIIRDNSYSKSWLNSLEASAIIGSVRFVDCVTNHSSVWAEKSIDCKACKDNENCPLGKCPHEIYNWVVADPILFDKAIMDVKGKLNFWESFHEPIICPECGQIQCAKVENTTPFATFIHDCEKCEYIIMESEWQRADYNNGKNKL